MSPSRLPRHRRPLDSRRTCRLARRPHITSITVITMAALACAAVARPMLPDRADIPEEVKSLAGITHLGISVELRDGFPPGARLVSDELTAMLKQRVEESELAFSDDPKHARLHAVLLAKSHDDYEAAFSITYELTVRQDVIIPRTGDTLHVPTYTLVYGALAPEGEVRDTVKMDLHRLSDFIINKRIAQATFERGLDPAEDRS